MRILRLTGVLLTALAMNPATADSDDYAAALAKFSGSAEISAMLDQSYGYALFPSVGKGGIGVGGAYGKGRVYRGGQHVANTSLRQVSLGLQLGGVAFSEIILFKNQDAFDEFATGKFAFGAEASAVVVTAGAQAKLNTTGSSASASDSAPGGAATGGWNGSMATFVFAKGGLMYEATLGGQSFSYTPL